MHDARRRAGAGIEFDADESRRVPGVASRSDATGWAGPVFVALLAATLPLLVAPGPLAAGWIPDVAVLAVVAAGFRGTPDRAAMFGVAIGLLASLWSPEPFLLRPFVLGAAGYGAAHVAIVLDRDRTTIRMASAAVAVLSMRAAEFIAAALAGAAPADGTESLDAIRTACVAAGIAALATPPWFGLVRRWRLLAPLERSFRDV